MERTFPFDFLQKRLVFPYELWKVLKVACVLNFVYWVGVSINVQSCGLTLLVIANCYFISPGKCQAIPLSTWETTN